MTDSIRISVISPVYNAVSFVEESILSVLSQPAHLVEEHLIIDNLSDDGTAAILERYDHLNWIREADTSQSQAMNKGIALAKGNVLGFLNADDYYLPGTFELVAQAFSKGANVVSGQVILLFEDGSTWLNDPHIEFFEMLHHWKPNSFPNNPVGYFFHKSVIENIGLYNEHNHLTMDLEYLLKVGHKYAITKIDKPLGIYRYHPQAKTAVSSHMESYWSYENFPYIDDLIKFLPEKERNSFNTEKKLAYQQMNQFNSDVINFLNTGDSSVLKDEEILDIVRKSLKRIVGNADISLKRNQLSGFIVEKELSEEELSTQLSYLEKEFGCTQFILITNDPSFVDLNLNRPGDLTVFTTNLDISLLRPWIIKYMSVRYLTDSYAYAGPCGILWYYQDEEIKSIPDLLKFLHNNEIPGCGANVFEKNLSPTDLIQRKADFISNIIISEKAINYPTKLSIGLLHKKSEIINHKMYAAILSAVKYTTLKDQELALLSQELNIQKEKNKRTLVHLKDLKHSITWKIGSIIIKPILFLKNLWYKK